jgi:protein gp37
MGENSKIEWTDATWNPVVGCSIVSPGCTNCYAMRMAHRLEAMSDGKHASVVGARGVGLSHYTGTTKVVNDKPVWTGKLAIASNHALTAPLRWKKPRTIFVNSMGDLFHEDCPDEWIDQVFAVMALAPQHTFQVLTKRAERMRAYFDDAEHASMKIGAALGDMLDGDWIWGEGKQYRQQIEGMISLAHGLTPDDQGFAAEDFLPLPNVWLGVSTEDQKRADERLPHLVNTPAAIRFVSAEPLLGPVSLGPWLAVEQVRLSMGLHWTERNYEVQKIDWIIAGGESGPGARPMHPDWARSLRDQCAAADVPYFFKQWGEFHPGDQVSNHQQVKAKGDMGRALRDGHAIDLGTMWTWRLGKKTAGRLLDRIEHNGMPS